MILRLNRTTRRVGAFALLLLAASCLFLLLRPKPPRIQLLPMEAPPVPTAFQRLIASWSWKLKRLVSGNPKGVDVRMTILNVTDIEKLRPFEQVDEFVSSTNEVRIYLANKSNLEPILDRARSEKRAEVLSRPAISTADGVTGSVFMGSSVPINGTNRSVGLDISFTPTVRRGSTDCSLTMLATELANSTNDPDAKTNSPPSIQTNLAVNAHMRIPVGMGALVLNLQKDSPSKGLAVFIWVSPQK